MTIEEFRGKVNNVKTIEDIVKIIKIRGTSKSSQNRNYTVCRVRCYIIGWDSTFKSLYVTSSGELIGMYTNEDIGKIKNLVLDTILRLNDNEQFYSLYFKQYGYSFDEQNMSSVVRDVFKYFNSRDSIITNICISDRYTSASITGKKKNGFEVEYQLANCDKLDILNLIELTHIKPMINKSSLEYYPIERNKPCISTNDIMDCYNEYKDSLSYE